MDFTNIKDNESQNTKIKETSEPILEDYIDDELGDINPTVIKIIGCGGGGSSAVQRMIEDGVSDVQFIVLNTDKQALHKSSANLRVPIGQKITGGLGAGGNPQVGEDAAREDADRIKKILEGANMVVITAGMGGGTGTGSAPVVAQIANEMGILTIAVVTTPFDFEGAVRMRNANEGLKRLKEHVDSLIVLPNDLIFKAVKQEGKRLTFKEQFKLADNILCAGVKGVTELITKPGPVNLDFADVSSIMRGSGESILGVGKGKGENRINEAVEGAIANPLLENRQIDGARKILINITTNGNLSLEESQEIANSIKHSADKNANIIWGLAENESMEDDDLTVTVIATDFNESNDFGMEEETNDEEKDDTVFNYGEFQKAMNGGTVHQAAAEETVEQPQERVSSVGISTKTLLRDLEASKEKPEEILKERTETRPAPAQPQVSEKKEIHTTVSQNIFKGRDLASNSKLDLQDNDTPAVFRKRLDSLPRSIDLTQM